MTLIIDESLTAKGFTPAAQAPGRVIEFIGIHHWGSYGQTHDGVNNFFTVTGPGLTSAHFTCSAGRVNCLVSPPDVSWAMGTWAANLKAVTIELRPEATDADYRTAAELIAWIRATYGANLPLRPHRDFVATACPGVWDLARLDRMAREIAAGAAAPIVPATAAELAPNPAPVPGVGQCRVDPGDTLSGIAQQFGVSLEDLIRANGITNPDLIFPGMILNLPSRGRATQCIVSDGDSLSAIGQQFGVDWQAIARINGIRAPYTIRPGQVLNLP
jgi:N-acetylmuramoyl-L-alanine amidase